MAKRKMIWVAGALALATIAVLAGCSADRGAAEVGRGPAWRMSAEPGQEQTEQGGRGPGQGRWISSEDSPQPEGRPASGPRDLSETGIRPAEGQPRYAFEEQFEDKGEIVVISGDLVDGDGHWFLETESGEYQLGFGRHDYLESTGIPLVEGGKAEVRGHMMEDGELSVVTCETDEGLYTFRTEDGVPLWSGRYRAMTEAAEAQSRGRGSGGGGTGRGRNG